MNKTLERIDEMGEICLNSNPTIFDAEKNEGIIFCSSNKGDVENFMVFLEHTGCIPSECCISTSVGMRTKQDYFLEQEFHATYDISKMKKCKYRQLKQD